MAGINTVRRYVMSLMTKKADDGIMITLPDSKKVELNLSIIMDALMRNGIDPDALTNTKQVDNALNMIQSRMSNRAIPADSDEGREITEKLFGKQKAPVFDMEGNRIPEGSGIMGGKSVKDLMESGQVTKGPSGITKSKKVQDREMFEAANKRLTSDVDGIIKNIKSMEPIDAMKEANSVIGRKGPYKNLTEDESKKILQDTEDHIFERDIPEEDFASGGRAGFFMGSRPAVQKGLSTLKEMLKYFGKKSDSVKKPSDILKIVNPKRLNQILEDPNIYRKFDVEKGIAAPELIKNMQKQMIGDRQKTIEEMLSAAKNIKGADDNTMKYKNEMIEDMIKKGVDREMAEEMAETMITVTQASLIGSILGNLLLVLGLAMVWGGVNH